MASEFLKKKAQERAESIEKTYGSTAYGASDFLRRKAGASTSTQNNPPVKSKATDGTTMQSKLQSALSEVRGAIERQDPQEPPLSPAQQAAQQAADQTRHDIDAIQRRVDHLRGVTQSGDLRESRRAEQEIRALQGLYQRATTENQRANDFLSGTRRELVTEDQVRAASDALTQAKSNALSASLRLGSALTVRGQNPFSDTDENIQRMVSEAQENSAAAHAAEQEAAAAYNKLAGDYQYQKYAGLRMRPDFLMNSYGDAETANHGAESTDAAEIAYARIYGRDHATAKPDNLSGDIYRYVTDDEARLFYYLWNTQGKKAASEYLKSVEYQINERLAAEQQERINKLTETTAGKVYASAASVLLNQGSIIGVVDLTMQNIRRMLGDNRPIDYNTQAQAIGKAAQQIRANVSENLEGNTKTQLFGITNLAAFLYQTGMSMADSSLQLVLNRFGVPEPVTLALMSGGAAQQAVYDAKERGASDGQALLAGYAAGIAEYAFEKISLDNLAASIEAKAGETIGEKLTEKWTSNLAKKVGAGIINAGKQGLVEGSEEAFTTLSNTVTDLMINGDKSELLKDIDEMGTGPALRKWITGLALDAMGGIISGVGMGAGGNVLRYAGGVAEDAASAARAAAEKESGQAQAETPTEPEMRTAPPTPSESNPLSKALDKLRSGEQLTKNDARRIMEDEASMQTLRDAGLARDIRPGGDGREQIRQAVASYARLNANLLTQAQAQDNLETNTEEVVSNGRTVETPDRATAETAGEPQTSFRERARAAAETQRSREILDREERRSGLGRFLAEYRANRAQRSAESQFDEQNRRANSLRNQAEARNLTFTSAAEQGVPGGTKDQTFQVMPADMLDRNMRTAQQEAAKNGIDLQFMIGQGRVNDSSGDYNFRGWISADGKRMLIQADHSKLTWQQILDHEELHKLIKSAPGYREAVEDALLSDARLQPYLSSIVDRYAEAYNSLGVTDENEIIEELLADYRAGFDMLDIARGKAGDVRTKATARKDIRAVEKRVSRNGEVTVVDGVAMATNEADTVTADPKPFDEMSAGKASIETFPDWAKNYIKNGGDAQEIIDQLRRFTEQMVANDVIYGYVPSGRYAYNSEGPLRKNDEYVRTFDMDASCPRTFQFLNYRNKLRQMAGRPLTYNESIQLVELMRAYGQQIPCTYCYVENKRILLDRNYLNWFDYRNAVLSADTDEEARTKMYSYNPTKGTLTSGATKQLAAWRQGDRSYQPSAVDVWTAMQTAKNSVFNYLDGLDRSGALSRKTPKTRIIEDVCEEFGVTEKAAQDEVSDYVSTWIYDRDAQVPHQYAILNDTDVSEIDQQALVLHRTAMSYANSASSARGVDNYMPYTDQLKNFEQFKKRIMAQGGIRKHSSNDFRIDYVQDYFLFFADLAAGKWTGHTYTKNADYVRIFGRTGDRINISVAFTEENGKIRENWQEGMGWRDAKQLRQDYYDNVGVMAMVTSNAQLSYALNADWIDMIIPFHSSGLDKAVWYDLRGWFDFTSKQHERFLNADQMKQALREKGVEAPKGTKAQKIKALYDKTFGIKHIVNEEGKEIVPHFLPGSYEVNGQTIPGHNNDIDTYMKLCQEYGVIPRFQGILVDDGKGNQVDVTEHPNYMKLVKETARTETEQKPIQFNFNEYDEHLGMSPFEYAMQRMEEEARNGGYENTAEDPYGIVDEFAREYLGKNKPLTHGVDAMLTERARDHKEQLAEMQAEEEARQAQVVQDSIDEGLELGKARRKISPSESESVEPAARDYNQQFSRELDPDTLRDLDEAERTGDVIHLYRTMEVVEDENGRKALRSPMADTVRRDPNAGKTPKTAGNIIFRSAPFGYVDENGDVYDIGDGEQTGASWIKADEHPETATMKPGAKWASTNIGKPVSGDNTGVAYNPYNHASNYVLNDQFKGAYERPNLVTVEVIVPRSEEDHPYHADMAKDPVGWADWKSGDVATALAKAGGEPRRLFLSRWMKVVRVLSDAEVADRIVNHDLKGTGIKIPANTVTPSLREALREIDPDIISEPQNPKSYYAYQAKMPSGNTSREIDPQEIAKAEYLTEQRRAGRTGGLGRKKVSRVRTHAYELGGLYNEVEAQMAETQPGEFTYDPISEKRSMDEALGRLRKDFSGEAEKLSSSDQWGGSDLDTAMGILYQYRQVGRDTGDYSLFHEWSHIIQEKGTKGGQFVQAFAKYSRTATERARKAAEDLRDSTGKLTPAEQKREQGHVNELLGAIDGAAEAAAREAVEGPQGLQLPTAKGDNQKTKDALNIIKEIHDIYSLQNSKNHGVPVEDWTTEAGGQLAGKIASRLNGTSSKTQTTMQTILSDLVTFAQEHALPTQEARQHRTALDRITDYMNNREAYAEAWNEAKQVLRDMYADDEEKLEALESFLNATISYNGEDFDRTMYRAILESADLLGMSKQDILDLAAVGTTESVIDRIAGEFIKRVGTDDAILRDTVVRHIGNLVRENNVNARLERMENRASKALDIKFQQLLRESRRTKADAANAIAQYLINDLDISSTDAAIAADHIAGHYMDRLNHRANRELERMFAERGERLKPKQRDKLLDLIRLGGLTNANVEDAVVDTLGLGKLSRAKQREITATMAQFADTLDAIEDNDLEGLRSLIRQQAAARNTKLDRMAEKVLSGETDVEYLRNLAMAQLDLIAADYKPRTAGEKISTAQIISHLLNARTAMRNLTSNQAFDMVDSLANNVGLLPDIIMGAITGQRSVGLNKSWASQQKRQGAIKGAGRNLLEIALDAAPNDRNQSKYGTGGRRTFAMASSGTVGKILSQAERILGYELNTTDEFHKGSVYGETMESLARFVDRGDMTVEQAAEFATDMALYRSFQDSTVIGSILGGLKDVLNIIGTGTTNGKTIKGLPVHDFGLGDLVVKYTQVPGALIHRAIEFSPVGYLKAIYNIAQLGNLKSKGESTLAKQRAAALSIGRATTGTGLITLFALLAKAGLLRRKDDEKDKNAAALRQSQGFNGTQLNVSALGRMLSGGSLDVQEGDVLADIGFLEPLDSLMTIAALAVNDPEIKAMDLYDMFRNPKTAGKMGEKSLQGIWLALEDTSAMQTLSNIYSTVRYHDEANDLPLYMQIPMEIAASSVSGFIPAPIRQIAQATDTVYRDQYRSQNLLDQTAAKVANAIPGVRQQLAPKLTPLGEEKAYQAPALNALNAILSPGNISVYHSTAVTDEFLRVYDQTGEAKILPERNAPYSITINKEKYTLTPDERTQYQETRGKVTTQFADAVRKSKWYNALPADEQAEVLNWCGNFANYVAKTAFMAERGEEYTSKTYAKYYDEWKTGASPADVAAKANKQNPDGTASRSVPTLKLPTAAGDADKDRAIVNTGWLRHPVPKSISGETEEETNILMELWDMEGHGGNVNLRNRKAIPITEDNTDTVRGWGMDADGGYMTVASQTYRDGKTAIVVTPILRNGDLMTQQELDAYMDDLMARGGNYADNDDKGIILGVFGDGSTWSKNLEDSDAFANRVHELHEELEEIRGKRKPTKGGTTRNPSGLKLPTK